MAAGGSSDWKKHDSSSLLIKDMRKHMDCITEDVSDSMGLGLVDSTEHLIAKLDVVASWWSSHEL